MVPKVDTFAKDISEEIKHKEASLTDIATASNTIENKNVEAAINSNKTSRMFFLAILLFCVIVIGVLGFVYFTFTNQTTTELAAQTETSALPATAKKLATISSTLDSAIGRNVTSVEKKEGGYVLTLSEYSPVFAYMTRQESSYADELLASLSPIEKSKTANTTTATPAQTPSAVPEVKTSTTSLGTTTPLIKTATSSRELKGTSTPKNTSVSTTSPSQEEQGVTIASPWTNVTLSNINMRVYKDGDRMFVYSFVSTKKLVIARTPEEVLKIKSAIIK